MGKKKGGKKQGGKKGKSKGKKGKKKEDVVEEIIEEKKVEDQKEEVDDDMMYPTQRILYVKSDDQLDLTDAELKEEHIQTLTWADPNVPENMVRFDYNAGKYKKTEPHEADHVAVHLSMPGDSVFLGTKEGDILIEENPGKKDGSNAAASKTGEAADSEAPEFPKADEMTKNQFNFSDRACQTFNCLMREFGVSTVPPPTSVMNGSVTQWKIHDAYMEAYQLKMREEEFVKRLEKKKSSRGSKAAEPKAKEDKDEDVMHTPEMGKALKIIERMVNQNREDEIYQDFKYWEDLSDSYREGEGSMLPLWRFTSDRTKHKHVTGIAWHPFFPDLFAVSFGSYNFMHQSSGLIYCYSLKNTSFPEFTFSTESGVMCLDFHPQHHSLLCAGCYDGTVVVFDVRSTSNRPIYASTVKTGKHTDPVFQVIWQEEDLSKELNFYSISLDGRVANWLMSNSVLNMEVVMGLKLLSGETKELEDDTSLTGLAGGTCFDFNTRSEHLFVVGTEEGTIHKCSKAYSGTYLETYDGHHMIVYSVKWNRFHPRIFMSCSADWTVKIWDHTQKKALMTFDLGEAVGDVAWSPFSSTVFAAVTSDGKVHIYDLSINKHEAVCEQKVMKRSKLTKVCFNSNSPIICCGDERGSVVSLKLSPNLRRTWKVKPFTPAQVEEEVARMDTLVANVDAKIEGKSKK